MTLQKLFSGFSPEILRFNEPLCEHTSFKIGGPADLMLLPQTKEQLVNAIKLSREHEINYFIMGNGTNLLVSDSGYAGVVIKTEQLSAVEVNSCELYVEAGASLAKTSNAAMNASLAGFEFASGIPGSFGGAVCMNAGAYGGEIKDVLVDIEVVTTDGTVQTLSKTQAELSYRGSKIQRDGLVVISGRIALEHGDIAEIKARSDELNAQRREKQPLEYPSAGSTFKRPLNNFAGKLIQDAFLAGYSVGGAMVSPKHCGFVINTGGASADDVLRLIAHVQDVVNEKFGVEMEPEIKILR